MLAKINITSIAAWLAMIVLIIGASPVYAFSFQQALYAAALQPQLMAQPPVVVRHVPVENYSTVINEYATVKDVGVSR